MKLTSYFDRGKLYWRTFKSTDRIYIVGLSDGWINPGQTIDINENGPSFQLEVKWDNFEVTPANKDVQYHNDDIRVIDSQGTVVTFKATYVENKQIIYPGYKFQLFFSIHFIVN